MKLTYKELHKLIDKNIDIFVKTPTGNAKIINKFKKISDGYIIKYDDNTETRCATSHNMRFNGDLKGATEIKIGDVDDWSHKKVISKEYIKDQEFYDFEIENQDGLYIQNGIIHHNSGKSLVISILIEYFRQHNLKGILLVPNINLLTQFKADIKSYNLMELYNSIEIHGDGNKSNFEKPLTISTWQSMMESKDKLNFDYVICDECHRFASDETSDIIAKSINTKIKLGFTGTLPEDPVQKMTLLGLFGKPQNVIGSSELIDRGLATPVKIKSLIFNYNYNDKCLFAELKDYQKQLQFILEHEKRNQTIVHLACGVSQKNKNCLVLFQRTLHGKQLFIDIMKKLYPDVKVEEKNITGKKSLEFQKQYHVYFLNGEQSSKIREEVRKILEEAPNAILIGNYALLSTGINIKALQHMILASPMKAFTTVSQSIGRLMRLHPNKKESVVFDIVDNFGFKKPSGIFWKQYKHRIQSSYDPEEFPYEETNINL